MIVQLSYRELPSKAGQTSIPEMNREVGILGQEVAGGGGGGRGTGRKQLEFTGKSAREKGAAQRNLEIHR